MEVAGDFCMPCGAASKSVPPGSDIVFQFAGELLV